MVIVIVYWMAILGIEIHRRHCLALYYSIEHLAKSYINEINAGTNRIEAQKTSLRSWALWKEVNAKDFS